MSSVAASILLPAKYPLGFDAPGGSVLKPAHRFSFSQQARDWAEVMRKGDPNIALVNPSGHLCRCWTYTVSFSLTGSDEAAPAIVEATRTALDAMIASCGRVKEHPLRQYTSVATDYDDMLAALATSATIGTAAIEEVSSELYNVTENRGADSITFSVLGNEIFGGCVRFQIWAACADDPRGYRMYHDTLLGAGADIPIVHVWHECTMDARRGALAPSTSHYQLLARIDPLAEKPVVVPVPVAGHLYSRRGIPLSHRDPGLLTYLSEPSFQSEQLRQLFAKRWAEVSLEVDQILYLGEMTWQELHSNLAKAVHQYGATSDNRHMRRVIKSLRDDLLRPNHGYDRETRLRPAASAPSRCSTVDLTSDTEEEDEAWQTAGRPQGRQSPPAAPVEPPAPAVVASPSAHEPPPPPPPPPVKPPVQPIAGPTAPARRASARLAQRTGQGASAPAGSRPGQPATSSQRGASGRAADSAATSSTATGSHPTAPPRSGLTAAPRPTRAGAAQSGGGKSS